MILVTGATGFLGQPLVCRLIEDGREVISVSRSGKSVAGELSLAIDLVDPKGYNDLAPYASRIRAVIHLAGRVEISLRRNSVDFKGDPEPGTENEREIYRHNFLATVELANFCIEHRIERFLFASSQTVYGMPRENPLTELSPTHPLEHYALSKLICEKFLRLASSAGLSSTVLRFPGLYGERRRTGLVYNLVRAAVLDRRIRLQGDFPMPLDVLHVDDVVDAFSKALDAPSFGGRTLNIATGEPCSIEILAAEVASCISDVTVEGAIPAQPVVCLDASEAFCSIGWKATSRGISLREFIRAVTENIAES